MPAVEVSRAEVVAADDTVATRFRELLQGMCYVVAVRSLPELSNGPDADLILIHVPHQALAAERRGAVRPGFAAKRPASWLEALSTLRNRAPHTAIVVAIPPVEGAADKALIAGATDVIEENVTPALFRRRMQMVEAFYRLRAAGVDSPVWIPGIEKTVRQGEPRADKADGNTLELPLPELRNPQSGRIDARSMADYLGVPLRRLAEAVGLGYAGVHKTPDSARVQEALRPVVGVLELANRAFGDAERVRKWLNRPLHELEDESPLAVILAGEASAVETLLTNALTGIPA